MTKTQFVAGAILFFVTLIPRVLPFPPLFFTDDEMQIGRWTAQMARALLAGNWSNTVNNAYPAVTLAWLETAQIKAIELWSVASPVLSDAGPDVFAALPRQRMVLALVNAGIIMVVFWWLHRLYNPFIAVTATLLMALDPFLLTQARVFRTEGLTTGLMLLSALAIILYAKELRWSWLIISGILAGLATLTKITSIFLLPFAGLTLLVWSVMTGRYHIVTLLRQIGRDVFLWIGVMGLTMFVLWPALWVAPLATFNKVFGYLQQAATNIETIWGGKDSALFFQGQILREDPGIFFYLWSIAYRTTPVVWLGIGLFVLGGLAGGVRRQKSGLYDGTAMFSSPYLPVTLLMIAYVVFYFVAMSLGASKVDRYLMPIFPCFSIVAAVGFQVALESTQAVAAQRQALAPRPTGQSPVFFHWAIAGAILLGGVWLALPYHPYYFTYWNPLLGGGREAVKILPAGGRQGIDMMAAYVNALPEADRLNLTGPGIRDCPVIFKGNCLQLSDFLQADYVVSDIFSLQREVYLANIREIIPEAKLIDKYAQDGVDYAWLYKMPAGLRHTDQWLGDHGKLRGYGLLPPTLRAGEPLKVTIFWINGEKGWTLGDSEFWVKLFNEQGQVQQVALVHPTVPANPDLSEPGDMLVGEAQFDLPPDMALGQYPVEIGLRLKSSGEETWTFRLTGTDNTVVVNGGMLSAAINDFSIQHRLEATVGETGLVLSGYNPPGEGSPLYDFYWQVKQPVTEDYILELALLNAQGDVVTSWDNSLSPQIHPVTAWQVGEIVKVSFPLASGHTLPRERYVPTLSVHSVKPAGDSPEAVIPLEPWPEDFTPERPDLALQHKLDDITFGRNLDLLGYDLSGKSNGEGGSLFVTLYWLNRHPLEPVEVELQAFDNQGQVIAQQSEPLTGSSTSLPWQGVNHFELTLTNLPAAIAIKARLVDAPTWYTIERPGQPEREQWVIEDVPQKITIVPN